MGATQGKYIDVGSLKLHVKTQLNSDTDKKLYLVKDVSSGQPFILKRTIVRKGLNDVLARAKWEADLYQKIAKHKNLLSCYGLKRFLNKNGDAENLLILEYCSGGSLKTSLEKRKTSITLQQALSCIENICSCLVHLHGQVGGALMHLGVRTDNIFLHANGQWKLGDFGNCALSPVQCSGPNDLKKFEPFIEIPRVYRAPEIASIHKSHTVDTKADVWALGCVFYALLYNRLPFNTNGSTSFTESAIILPDSPTYAQPVLTVLHEMLTLNPAQRISSKNLRTRIFALLSSSCNQLVPHSVTQTVSDTTQTTILHHWGHTSFGTTVSLSTTLTLNVLASLCAASSSPCSPPLSPQRKHGSIGDVSEWLRKAIGSKLERPKAKHIRRLLILSWERHDTGSLPLPGFFECLATLSVLSSSLVAFKALQTIHKMIQGGPHSFIDQALLSRSVLISIGEKWSMKYDWLAEIIVLYANALEQRLLFVRGAFVFEGNFSIDLYLSQARIDNFSSLRASVWLCRCYDSLMNVLDHGQSLIAIALIALRKHDIPLKKSRKAFVETVLQLVFDDLIAIFRVSSFLIGIVKDTQTLFSSDYTTLYLTYTSFFEQTKKLMLRFAEAEVQSVLHHYNQLGSVLPSIGLQCEVYPGTSNVPGLARYGVEYCEELLSFFHVQLEAIGVILLPLGFGTMDTHKLQNKHSSAAEAMSSLALDFNRLQPAIHAGTAPARRAKNSRYDIEAQKSLQEFMDNFEAASQASEQAATAHRTSCAVTKKNLPPTQSIDYSHIKNKKNMSSNFHRQHSLRASIASPALAVSGGVQVRSRTWSRAGFRERSHTGIVTNNALDSVEWTAAAEPDAPAFSISPPPKFDTRKRRVTNEVCAMFRAQKVCADDTSRNLRRLHTAVSHTAETTCVARNVSVRRPRSADFQPTPFDQLIITDERLALLPQHCLSPFPSHFNESHISSKTTSKSMRDNIHTHTQFSVLEKKSLHSIDDENPFVVIENSMKSAKSQRDLKSFKCMVFNEQQNAVKITQTTHEKLQEKIQMKHNTTSKNDGEQHHQPRSLDDDDDDDDDDEDNICSQSKNEVSTRERSLDESCRSDESSSSEAFSSTSMWHDEIDYDEIVLSERIGVGGFAEVHKGEWRGTEVAIKKLLIQKQSEETLHEFRKEVNILRRLRHPNIVMFMGACTKSPNLSLVTELLQMSLFDLLHNTKIKLSWKIRFKVSIDTATGMNFLHMSKPTIIHRDLKSANLLLDTHYGVKVSDFGLSRVKTQNYTMTGQCGTFQWMAPEVIANERYTEKADVYSFGIILWEVIARQVPFDGMNGVQVSVAVATRDLRPSIPSETPEDVAQLIRECWSTDPDERPVFGDICKRLKAMRLEMIGI